jgi:hypothetical protein
MSRWFRFYDDAINDPKIIKLPEATRWHWVALLCVASKNDGALPSLDDVAILLRVKPDKAAEIIVNLEKAGLLDQTETGFAPHNWNARQYKSDTTDATAAQRMRRYRENKRNNRNAAVTVTDTREQSTETDTETHSHSEADASAASVPDLFDEFWGAYPERGGDNPEAPAEASFRALVKSGVDPHQLIAAASAFASAERARGNVGTRYIPHAVKWLDEQRWRNQAKVEPPRPPEAPDWPNIISFYAKTGRWMRAAGPEPGHLGCKAPPELLATYGIGADGRRMATA